MKLLRSSSQVDAVGDNVRQVLATDPQNGLAMFQLFTALTQVCCYYKLNFVSYDPFKRTYLKRMLLTKDISRKKLFFGKNNI